MRVGGGGLVRDGVTMSGMDRTGVAEQMYRNTQCSQRVGPVLPQETNKITRTGPSAEVVGNDGPRAHGGSTHVLSRPSSPTVHVRHPGHC